MKILRQAVILFLFLFLAGLVFLLGISIKPLPLGFLLGANENKFDFGGNELRYSTLALFFDAGFGVTAESVTFLAKNAKKPAVLDELEVRFHTLPLFHLRLLPRVITARGLKLDAELSTEGFTAGGMRISPAGNKEQEEPAADLISLLNNADEGSPAAAYLNALEEFRVEKARIVFHDKIRAQDWQADKLRVHLGRSIQGSLELKITLGLAREGAHLPMQFDFIHEKNAQSAALRAKISVPNLKLLAGYVPAALAEGLTCPTVFKVRTVLGAGNKLAPPQFSAACREGALHLPAVFSRDLEFAALEFAGDYDFSANGTLTIPSFKFQDRQGFTVNANAKLSSLSAIPFIEAAVSLSPVSIDHLAHYLPDSAAPALSRWLDANLNLADIREAKVELSGPLAEFPFGEDNPGTKFHAAFQFDNLEVVYLSTFPPGRGLSGTFAMDRGIISIRSPAGKISNQQVSELAVTIGDLMKRGQAPLLTVKGQAAGDAADALSAFVRPLAKNSRLPEIQGTQTAQVNLAVPLAGKSNGLTFSVQSGIRQTKIRLPDTPFTFESDLLTVNSTDRETTIQSNGRLNNRPTTLSIRESTAKFGENTVIDVETEIGKELCDAFIPKRYLALDGTAKSAVALRKRSGAEDSYTYELNVDFLKADTDIPVLKWTKRAGTPGSLRANGVFSAATEVLEISKLALTGPAMNIGASGRVLINQPQLSELSVSPLVVGETDISVRYAKGKTAVTGRKLDYKALTAKEDNEPSAELPALDLSVNIDDVKMNHGNLRQAAGTVKTDAGSFTALDFSAKAPAHGDARLYIESGVLKGTSTNAGAVLKVLGLSGDIRGGTFTGSLSSPRSKRIDIKDAEGSFSIRDVRVLRSPVLFKILSYFSLEKWLSSKEGAIFSEVGVTYALKNSMLEIKEANLSSPLLTIYFSGTINTLKGEMDLKGKAVPLRSAGEFTENIPLVGKGVSAIQKRLLGANFTVKGPNNNPDVSFLTLPF